MDRQGFAIVAVLCEPILPVALTVRIISEKGILAGTRRQYLHHSGERLPRRNRHASPPSRNPLAESLR